MRRWLVVGFLLALLPPLAADDWEEVEFVQRLLQRSQRTRNQKARVAWMNLAVRYGEKTLDRLGPEYKVQMARLLKAPVMGIRAAETDSTRSKRLDRLHRKLEGILGAEIKWSKLMGDLKLIRSAAAQAEAEVDPEKKKRLAQEAREKWAALSKEAEAMIKELRENIAKRYPTLSRLWMVRKRGMNVFNRCMQSFFWRDGLELEFAKTFIYMAKVQETDAQKKDFYLKAIAKLKRFIDADPEYEGDADPPRDYEMMKGYLKEAEKRLPPDEQDEIIKRLIDEGCLQPREMFPTKLLHARYWLARAYADMGDTRKALLYARYVGLQRGGMGEMDEKTLADFVEGKLMARWLIGQIHIKEGRLEEAVKAFYDALSLGGQPLWRGAEQTYPLLIHETAQGQMIALELAKCLAKLNRHAEAITVAYRVYVSARTKARRGGAGELRNLEIEAAIRLATLYDAVGAGTQRLSMGHMFGIAQGYLGRALQESKKLNLKEGEAAQKPEIKKLLVKAFDAYRAALSSPASREERLQMMPEALFDLGYLLQVHLNRPFQAGVAYMELIAEKNGWDKTTFPRSKLQEAARAAVACFRRYADWSKTGKELYQTAIRERTRLVGKGKEVFDELLAKGFKALQQKAYEDAINSLEMIPLRLPATPPNKEGPLYTQYGLSRAYLGQAYYDGFTQGAGKEDWLDKAQKVLEGALAAMKKEKELRDPLGEVKARFFLAKVYLREEFLVKREGKVTAAARRKWAEKSVALLGEMERRVNEILSNSDRDSEAYRQYSQYAVHGKVMLIQALIAAGNLERASSVFDEFKRKYARKQSELFLAICLKLFKTFSDQAKAVEATDRDYARQMRDTAAKILDARVQELKRLKKFDSSEALKTAHWQMSLGKTILARRAFEDYLRELGSIPLSAPDKYDGTSDKINRGSKKDREDAALNYRLAHLGIAEAYAEEGKWRRAAETLDKLNVLVRCGQCGRYFNLVDPDAYVRDREVSDIFAKDGMKARLTVKDKRRLGVCPLEGQYVRCPKCNAKFFIPYKEFLKMRNSARSARPETHSCPNCRRPFRWQPAIELTVLEKVAGGDYALQLKIAEYYVKAHSKSARQDPDARNRAEETLTAIWQRLEYTMLYYQRHLLEKQDALPPEEVDKLAETTLLLKQHYFDLWKLLLWIYLNDGRYGHVQDFMELRNDSEPLTSDKHFERVFKVEPEEGKLKGRLKTVIEQARGKFRKEYLPIFKKYYEEARKAVERGK